MTLLGNFIITPEDNNLQYFIYTFISLQHLINEPT